MNVTKTSILSGKTTTLFVAGLTQEMLDRWKDGELVQDALAGISPGLREFVMTGITPKEWGSELPPGDEQSHGGMSEVEREMGMAHGNRGLADYGGLSLDHEGCIGHGCSGCYECEGPDFD